MGKPAPAGRNDASETKFHALGVDDVLRAVAGTTSGLTSDEAARRLAEHGRNALAQTAGRNPLLRFLAHFNNALIYFLLAASITAFMLGHHVDAAVILAVVLVNAVVGFVQEGKAERALDAIRGLVSPQAHLLRGGRRVSLPVADIVPGDIVLLEAGDRVPADLRLIRAHSLLIDEAILTGESVAAEKQVAAVAEAAALGDRRSMAFSGTLVAAGQAIGVAVATGADTQIGRISSMLRDVRPMTTPLLRQINRFGTQITWIAIAVAAALFVFAVALRGYSAVDALIVVVALAVGFVPEGLPAVITITLAIGVERMARRNAAIRQLPAVETLGATSVICSDKTGTLTRNEMTARRIELAGGRVMVTGTGYDPAGELQPVSAGDDGQASLLEAARSLVLAGLLCNDAELRHADGRWSVAGDPMEGALVALATKAGLDQSATRHAWPRLDAIPFDARHRFMATLNQAEDGSRRIFVKGAPDELLRLCALQAEGPGTAPLDDKHWLDGIAAAASEGERVLGFAARTASPAATAIDFPDIDALVFLGLVGFIDPPRDEAITAVAECRSAGIQVKMITGDHGETAAAIARQLGLGDDPHALTGRDLDRLSDADLPAIAVDTTVFARTSPEHKLRIVRALQTTGAVVAMTGDGVNDAPSLKQADVGIGMGHKGTDAAREASQMVLLDDNFASIVAAVREGRVVYDNIRKVTAWTLPTNGGEVLVVIAAILFNFTLPIAAVQILWINLLTATTLGLVLAFEPAEPNIMRRKPRPADQGLLTPFMIWRVLFVSFLFLFIALGVFFYARGRGDDVATARTMVVNAIVVLEIFYLFNVRYLHMTSFSWRGALGTPVVLVAVAVVVAAQLAFTYLPVMHELFGSRPIRFTDGLLIVATGVAMMIVLEIEKNVVRRTGWLTI